MNLCGPNCQEDHLLSRLSGGKFLFSGSKGTDAPVSFLRDLLKIAIFGRVQLFGRIEPMDVVEYLGYF
jgi:hypothetical protein